MKQRITHYWHADTAENIFPQNSSQSKIPREIFQLLRTKNNEIAEQRRTSIHQFPISLPFVFPIVRSHLSPKQNRTCPRTGRRGFSSLLAKHTNGSPGEYKHFKSLLPLSAASIYSEQIMQYFPSFLGVLFLTASGERVRRCQWFGSVAR